MTRLTPQKAAQEDPTLSPVISEVKPAEQEQDAKGAYEAPNVGFVITGQRHGSFVWNDIWSQKRGHASADVLWGKSHEALSTDGMMETGQLSAKV